MAEAVAAAARKQPAPPHDPIIKSPQDRRLYRRIVLPNGLTALLISDPEMADAVAAADGEGAEDADADHSDAESGSEEEEDDGSSDGNGSDDASGSEGGDDVDKGDKPQRAAKKAAAAMAVGVGSFSDPADLQGLSHYLEHMLFMGSEKFPDENDYDAFLASHGGASNAYTELELTNYQFDSEPKALHGALDRFAQFFLAPLCKADALEREVSAVDNEFAGVLQSDACRLAQLRCHTAVEGHPFRLFSWGNRRSLWDEPTAAGIPIRDRIVGYYRQQYSAERMSLVVLGGHDLDTLERWVGELFSGVPAGRGPRPEFAAAGPPFQGGRLYGLPAVKDSHSVTVTFQLPSLQAAYAAKADEYLAHLVGHEGSGSLLSALKARGWATGLSAGVSEGGHERSSAAWLFDVSVSLTDAGLAAGPGCGLAPVGLVFQFLNLLRQAGPQEWAFQELRDIAEMKFRFAEEEDACEYVTRLAGELHLYPPAHVLKGAWVFGEWDADLVQALLQQMTPANARVDVQSAAWDSIKSAISQMEGAAAGTEPWFAFDYVEAPLPPSLLQQWAGAEAPPELALPQRNAFIASDFSLVSERDGAAKVSAAADGKDGRDAPATNGVDHPQTAPSAFPEPPALAAEQDGLRLWHKVDAAFHVPRAAAAFMLASPAAYDSPRAAALTHLAAKLLEDALCETAYQAEVAALTCEVAPEGAAGLSLRLDGFSHKLPALAGVIFRTLAQLQVEESAFGRVREALARRYRNANMRPEQAANYARLFALRAAMWHVDAVLPHVEAATPTDLQEHLRAFLASTHLEGLVHGNLTAAAARAVVDEARAALGGEPLPAAARPADQAVQLPVGSTLYRQRAKNAEEDNSVVELYLQAGPDTAELRAKVDLLEQVAGEPAYDTLRTKQQLGYSVHVGTRLTHGALGFCVTVASGTHAPATLEARMEGFLDGFSATLAAMPAAEFERHRASLLAAKLQKDRSLGEEADRHWGAIFDRRYAFQAREREVAALEALQQRELSAWYAEAIAPGGAARRKLCVHVAGRAHATELAAPPADGRSSVVGDMAAWKASGLQLYPAAGGSLPAGIRRSC